MPLLYLNLIYLRFDSDISITLGIDPLGYQFPGFLNSLVPPCGLVGVVLAGFGTATVVFERRGRGWVLLMSAFLVAGALWLAAFSTIDWGLVDRDRALRLRARGRLHLGGVARDGCLSTGCPGSHRQPLGARHDARAGHRQRRRRGRRRHVGAHVAGGPRGPRWCRDARRVRIHRPPRSRRGPLRPRSDRRDRARQGRRTRRARGGALRGGRPHRLRRAGSASDADPSRLGDADRLLPVRDRARAVPGLRRCVHGRPLLVELRGPRLGVRAPRFRRHDPAARPPPARRRMVPPEPGAAHAGRREPGPPRRRRDHRRRLLGESRRHDRGSVARVPRHPDRARGRARRDAVGGRPETPTPTRRRSRWRQSRVPYSGAGSWPANSPTATASPRPWCSSG